MEFVKEANADGTSNYRFSADPRFLIVCESRPGQLGVGNMVFGDYSYGDGSPRVTGWHIQVEGSSKVFAPGKLVACKDRVRDESYREWALGKVV